MVDWNYYNTPLIDEINEKYLPSKGDGDSMATQACAAVNNLVYQWYNNGCPYDNSYELSIQSQDIVPHFANWLHNNLPELRIVLEEIKTCETVSEYEDILRDIADVVLDKDYLARLEDKPKVDSIYTADGIFVIEDDALYDSLDFPNQTEKVVDIDWERANGRELEEEDDYPDYYRDDDDMER